MKNPIFATYDRLAEAYGPLTAFTNDKVAIRSFNEACRTVDGFKQHASDIEIHRIGWFDDESGTFTPDKEILERGTSEL